MTSRLALAATLVASTAVAHADMAKAWTLARSRTPASTAVVIGIDVGALSKSPLFAGALAFVLGTQRSVQVGIDRIKTKCKLEPSTAITGAVIVADDKQREGMILLQLAIDQPTANACIDTIAREVLQVRSDGRIAIKKHGTISELAIDPSFPEPLARSSRDKPQVADRERIYLAWLDKQVLAIPLDIDNKPAFERWLLGRNAFAATRLGKAVATLDKRASIVAASAVPAHFDTPFPIQLGYAAITLGKSNVLANLRVALDSPQAATTAANRVNGELKNLIAKGGLSANVVTILKSVLIEERGSELALEASVPETHLLELLGALAR